VAIRGSAVSTISSRAPSASTALSTPSWESCPPASRIPSRTWAPGYQLT
jgi:hypothetical protein